MDPFQSSSGTKYNKDKVSEYGNEVTYSWTSTANVLSYKGTNGVSGTSSADFIYATNQFTWYDLLTKTWKTSIQDTSNPLEICTLTCTDFFYKATEQTGLESGTNAYNMVYGSNTDASYWLGGTTVSTGYDYSGFLVQMVVGGNVSSYMIYYTFVDWYDVWEGIRAAVTLEADINLTDDGSNSWSIQ